MYSEIAANKRKTIFIFTGFLALVAGLAWVFGQYSGSPTMMWGVIVGGLIYAFISYFSAAKMAVLLNGAHEISKKDNPRLYRIVENLAITEGLPTPKIYIIDDPAPNAFATGRNPNHSLVCATTGLLDIMDDQELQGVMAHELGHIKNYDIRVSMIAFALVAVVSLIADIMFRMMFYGNRDNDNDSKAGQIFLIIGIVAAILAPIAASLIQLAISRRREYLADATGALTTRYPEGLARALQKIGAHGSALKKQNTSTAHFFFANPLKKKSFMALFSTHPPIEDRVKRLGEMERHE
jgi:heat shock protein HtpX